MLQKASILISSWSDQEVDKLVCFSNDSKGYL